MSRSWPEAACAPCRVLRLLRPERTLGPLASAVGREPSDAPRAESCYLGTCRRGTAHPTRDCLFVIRRFFSGLFGGWAQPEGTTGRARAVQWCQTDSELDWVMYAARRSMPARAMPSCAGSTTAWRAGRRRDSASAFSAAGIGNGNTPRSDGTWLNRRFHLQERFAAEAERFRTRSLGERARMPQERETS
jgi:hypothetical protein